MGYLFDKGRFGPYLPYDFGWHSPPFVFVEPCILPTPPVWWELPWGFLGTKALPLFYPTPPCDFGHYGGGGSAQLLAEIADLKHINIELRDDIADLTHDIQVLTTAVHDLEEQIDDLLHPPPPPPPPLEPDLPVIQLNATLDITATKGNGTWINGSGIPATGVIKQVDGHSENAEMFTYRNGNTIQPFGVDQDGVVIFHGPDGPQVVDPAHGVSSANAARGAVAQGFSFDTGANAPGGMAQQAFLTAGGQEFVYIDLDPTSGVSNLALRAEYDPIHATGSSPVVFVAADSLYFPEGTILVNDNAGNDFVVQNFTNLAFFNSLIDHDPNVAGVQGGPIAPAGTYDFETVMVNINGQVLSDVHSQLILA
jgi:hypothetical protein